VRRASPGVIGMAQTAGSSGYSTTSGRGGGRWSPKWPVAPSRNASPSCTSTSPGYDPKTWKAEYWPRPHEAKRQDLLGTERVFVHPFVAEWPSGESGDRRYEFVLQYWFYYPVNDGPNDHEGDWEHINVIVSPMSRVDRPLDAAEVRALLSASQPLDSGGPLVIRRIQYYFHHFVYPMDFSRPNVYKPREVWEREIADATKGTHGERWLQERIRERAWRDEAQTSVNTHPIVWIGGDAIGIASVLEMPGLRDQDGHASYPFRGYFKQIGPGTGERVLRAFDHRRYFAAPQAAADYVEDFAAPGKVALLPDWERLTDPVLTDPDVRRDWAWFLLPIRYGFPATPSPGAGMVAHADMGNVSPVGPTFNGGWNRTGAASGYSAYDVVRLNWASPLGPADSFLPRAGFLNAPILYFMIKPPLDLVWRTLALPVRAAAGSRQPTFMPANAPPQRLVSLEAGAVVTPISQDFQALFLNRDQYLELAVRIAVALPPDAADLKVVVDFPTVAAPVYSLVFHLGPRFSIENSLTSYSAPVGFDVTASGLSKPVEVRARFEQFDYHGNLRFNLLTGQVQPYVKYGSGITWYQLTGVSVDGVPMITADSPVFRPKGRWYNFGFNELVVGGGIDVSRFTAGKTWLGLKVSYSAIHHQMGFEKDAAVELSSELAKVLAGTTYSVWRHQLRVLGTLSF